MARDNKTDNRGKKNSRVKKKSKMVSQVVDELSACQDNLMLTVNCGMVKIIYSFLLESE